MGEPLKKVVYDAMLLNIIKSYAPSLYEKALDRAMAELSEDGGFWFGRGLRCLLCFCFCRVIDIRVRQ